MVTVAMDTVVTGLVIFQYQSTQVAQGASDRVVSVSTIFIELIKTHGKKNQQRRQYYFAH